MIGDIVSSIARMHQMDRYKIERPAIASIDDAMAWAHDQVWKFDGDADCRQMVKRLMFASWLHEHGELSDGN